MAKIASAGTRIWLGAYNLSGVLNSASMDVAQEVSPVACFSDAGPRRVVGNYDISHSFSGFFDGVNPTGSGLAPDQVVFDASLLDTHQDLVQLHGSLTDMGSGLGFQSTEGQVGYISNVHLDELPFVAANGEAFILNLAAKNSNGGFSRGTNLRHALITGTSYGTGFNTGAIASGITSVCSFHVFHLGTFTQVNMILQDSNDDGAGDPYANVTAHTMGVLTAGGSVKTTTTGAIKAWTRISIPTFVGTNAVVGAVFGKVVGTPT